MKGRSEHSLVLVSEISFHLGMGGCQIKAESGFSKGRLCSEKLFRAGVRDYCDGGGGLWKQGERFDRKTCKYLKG